MISDYLNQIKAIVSAIILAAALWYVWDLNSTIDSQKEKLLQQDTLIQLQNDAALKSGAARDELQSRLDAVSKTNKDLAKENEKLKGDIKNRPSSKTCEEALSYVAATAKKVAKEFNSK